MVVALSCFGVLWLLLRRDSTRTSSLPPGPKGLPIIGNALEIPSSMPWKTFRDWAATYGKDSDQLELRVSMARRPRIFY